MINTLFKTLSIKPLSIEHFSRMHEWFNHPHVQKFYSLRAWTKEEVNKKLMPYLDNSSSIKGFIILTDNNPIVYIQFCSLDYNPWPDQDFSDEVVLNGVGIDFLIGEPGLIGRGLGASIIEYFLQEIIWPHYQYCVADPDIKNSASIKTLEKCGFTIHKSINTTDTLDRPVILQLMIIINT